MVAAIMSVVLISYLPINRFRFIGAMTTFLVLSLIVCFFKDRTDSKVSKMVNDGSALYRSIESKTALILVTSALLIIAWFGIDIFVNPYLYDYNHGNGAYFAQVLANICRGVGPENTVKYNEVIFYHSNPYYYASAFAAVPHILACLVLPLLYKIYPIPPMHVFAVVILVISFGSAGTYMAVRGIGGSRVLALFSSTGYCLIPWVELPVFMHGHFDVISYAVYPYVFAFLFSKRWLLFYISAFLLVLINIPYTYSAVALGIIVTLFFRAYLPGIVIAAIGVSVLIWDQAIVRESLKGIWDISTHPSGTMMQIFKDLDPTSFARAVLYHVGYFLLLFMTVAFIPIYGIRRDDRWNWPVIGMLLFACVGGVMGLFRSYDIASHRNANMVVPVYFSALMVITGYGCRYKPDGQKKRAMVLLLIAGIISTSFWFSNHYPWAALTNNGIVSLKFVRAKSTNDRYRHVLGKMNEYLPPDASVAYRIDSAIQAYVTNRQKAWYLGYHPAGAEYFFIQTKQISYIDKNLPPWQEELTKIERDPNNRLLYRDEMLVIFKNTVPRPIPRLESVLGWDVLFRPLLPKRSGEGSR